MRADIADLLSDLDTLSSEQDFRGKFERTFKTFGFDHYTYVGMKGDLHSSMASRTAEDTIFLTNVPAAWTERYIERGYHDVDPVFKACTSGRLPISWTERQGVKRWTAPEEKTFFGDAGEFGISRGFTVPIHGPSELGMVSLYSSLSDREFLKYTDTLRYDVHMVTLYLHDALQRTLTYGGAIPKPIPLTEREVEILKWTATGKTAWEVGSILSISERTVNFHLQNLMGKLGVHNKTHAAAKAMSFGLIHP